jgi:crotonobetainyl-CoA:carnitine CoA-transferase CaiB-like acyl-CoA transferase
MYDTSEALEDPQARHLQLLISAQHPTLGSFRTVRPPVSFDGERTLQVVPPPLLGEHNQLVRGELERARAADAAQPGAPSSQAQGR